MMLDDDLLEVLGCPLCKKKLIYYPRQNELGCNVDKVRFSIVNNVPILNLDKIIRDKD
jgi:uncharacterized protein